jgi:hypothetical protein
MTPVLRFKCDLCGKTHMTEALAYWCEKVCEQAASDTATTPLKEKDHG